MITNTRDKDLTYLENLANYWDKRGYSYETDNFLTVSGDNISRFTKDLNNWGYQRQSSTRNGLGIDMVYGHNSKQALYVHFDEQNDEAHIGYSSELFLT